MARPSGRLPTVTGLYVCLATAALAASLVPSLSLHARQMGASAPEVGLVAAAPLIIASVALHRVSGRHILEHRRLALAATALLAIVPPLCCLATAPWQLLCLRALLGLALFPTCNAAAIDPLRTQSRFLGPWAPAGWIVGPLLAGIAAESWGLGYSFLVAGLLGAAALAALVVDGQFAPCLGNPLEPPESPISAPGSLVLGIAAAALAAFLPLYAGDAKLGPTQVGALFAGAALAALAAFRLVERVDFTYPVTLTVGSILLGALACAGLAFSTALPAFVATATLIGLALGGAAAATGALRDEPELASPPGLHAGQTALAFAPPLIGVGIVLLGEEAMFLLGSIALAAAAVGAAILLPTASALGTQESNEGPPFAAELAKADGVDEAPVADANLEPAAHYPSA